MCISLPWSELMRSVIKVKWVVASLIIIPNSPLTEHLLPVPKTLSYVGLKILVPKRRMFFSGHFGLLIPLNIDK